MFSKQFLNIQVTFFMKSSVRFVFLALFFLLDIKLKAETLIKENDMALMNVALSAECEPLTTIADCVNLISGSFFQVEEDISTNTIDPIKFMRFYDSHSEYESFLGMRYGCQFPLLATEAQKNVRHSYAMISEREGFLIPYRSNALAYQIDPRILLKGYTNTGRSRGDFSNGRAKLDQKGWNVKLGDGSTRLYHLRHKLSNQAQRNLSFPTKTAFFLTEETKPNGNKLTFEYKTTDHQPHLYKISTLNRKGKVINALHFEQTKQGHILKSSCGRKTEYMQETQPAYLDITPDHVLLKSVKSLHKGEVHHQVHPKSTIITRIDKPQGRFLEIEWNKDKKVKSLKESSDKHKVTTHRFEYAKGVTKVWDAKDQLRTYHFNSVNRLSHIDWFEGSKIARREIFEWHENGRLKLKALNKGSHYYSMHLYDYDAKGNVKNKIYCGNLTGERPAYFDHSMDTDQYRVTSEYSEHNLLISQKTPQGLEILYDYLPHTNLCTHVFQKYDGRIQERIFHEYDDNGQIKMTIEDNGSGETSNDLKDVTYRLVKKIEAETNHSLPFFGKPKQILCFYGLDGKLVPLNKTVISYDSKGNESKKQIYDSKNKFCYETTTVFDEGARLIEEKDPVGKVTRYAYDENHNKIKEEALGKITYLTYDLGNRLISKEEVFEGQRLKTSYAYDDLNQLICQTDVYGNATQYAYDRLGNQISCIKPAMADGKHPTIKRKYNLLNQMVEETDANGHTTAFTYNAYGSPTLITHPDGTTERSIYYSCGWLKQQWKADGTSIAYTYNPKGKLTKESWLDANGTIIKEEEYSYAGPLLMYKKDAMGLITAYEYDKAGRKVKESIGKLKVTNFEYDDFVRVIKKTSGISELFAYDALDRVIEKKYQDGNCLMAHETYQYDQAGNQIKHTIMQAKDQSTNYQCAYSADGKIVWQEDPLGNRTTWQYNYKASNKLGQKILEIKKTDPLGRVILETKNIFDQIATREIYEKDKLISRVSFTYDAKGQVIKQQAAVIEDGAKVRDYSIAKSYTSRGLLASQKEMEKATLYFYDQNKRLIRKQKPEGVSLHYAYDALGRLKTLTSSDNTIAYAYEYDLHDNITKLKDAKRTQNRIFDLYSRLEQEERGAIIMQYAYDARDRLKEVTLPDLSTITYMYDPYHLREIKRTSQSKNYSITNLEYDLRGHLLKSQSPAGLITYTYDLLGRATSIHSAHFASFLTAFDAAGNVLQIEQKDLQGTTIKQLGYDGLDHLVKEANQRFNYDSLGNCIKKNKHKLEINHLNQLTHDGTSKCVYDANGNLKQYGGTTYTYDALDRLIRLEKNGQEIAFVYDALGRCLQIKEAAKTKHLLYQGDQEIGSLVNGKMQELRLVNAEHTFAIELQDDIFFCVQDFRHNICALQAKDGSLVQWTCYSTFGDATIHGNHVNPWGFANRRSIADLSLFAHRLYHPKLMRWQTPDPLRDGLNLYAYVRNNPYKYGDRDGRFALVLPFATGTFGVGGLILATPPVGLVVGALTLATVGYTAYTLDRWYDHTYNEIEVDDIGEKQRKPLFDGQELGSDSNRCPGPGFVWKGRGDPASGRGAWVRGEGKEQISLHPDFNHPSHAPHWDYEGEGSGYPDGARLYLDGTWEEKILR
jgi:RHS repeat-associated protein